MLRDRFFTLLTNFAASSRRRWVYLCAALLTLVSLILLPRLEILTTRQGMVRKDLPAQADFDAYMDDFGSPTQLVLLLRGEPETIKPAADDVARTLLADPRWVRNVFHRVDLEAFRRAGLYYLSLGELEAMRDFLAADPPRTRLLLADRDLPGLLEMLERETGGASLESLDHPAFGIAEDLLARWQAALAGEPVGGLDLARSLESLAADRQGAYSWIDPDGYLLSHDRRAAFLFVQQAEKTDEASFIVPFMAHARSVVAEALERHPGVTAGFTGWPAAIEEDYTLLITDLPRVSLLAVAVILAIFLVAFRSLSRTVLVYLPLVCGVVWNLGLTVLTIGHLNYLSSVFVGILFGLGIDFGIYFVRRFDEERLKGAEPRLAMRRTFATAGQGMITGGLTAVVAFLAIGATDQPAFSELGIVAGTGVALVLLATLLLLPPLLLQFPPGMKRAGRVVVSPVLEKSARLVLRRPAVPLGAGLFVLVLLAWRVPDVGFDYDLNNLLPADSETLKVLREMEEGSPFSDQFIAVIADDLGQVRRLHEALESADAVSHVESFAPAIPAAAAQKKPVLEQAAALLPPVDGRRAPADPLALARLLDGFLPRLEEAEEDAFAGGQRAALARVGGLRERLEAIRRLLGEPEAATRQAAFEAEIFGERDRLRERLAGMLAAEPLTLETLDPGLRERLLGASGRMAVLAFSTEPIWEPASLERFVAEARRVAGREFGETNVAGRVTGFAVTYAVTAPMIRRGFQQSSWAVAVVVALMLLWDLRRPRSVLLALIPLAVTVVVLLGGMAWLGVELTMATQVAFPILFGLGVAYGVHMVHRFEEPDGDDLACAVGTTGKAVWLAAATTMAGFGALMLAHHTALIGFGTILFLGILLCAAAALYLLPLVVQVIGIGGRRGDPPPRSR